MPGKPSVPCCCTHSGMSAPRHLPPASPSRVCAWWQPGDLPPSSWCALPAMADLHGEGPKLLMASVAEAGCGAPCSSLSCSNSESTEMEVTSAKSSIPPEPFCPLGILERGEVERVRWVARRHPGRHSLPPARSINGAQFTLPHLHFFSPQSLRANTRQESWQLCQRVLSAVGGKDTFKSPREGGRATRLCVGDGGSRGSRMLRVTFSLAAGSCLNKQNETLCCRLGEEIAEVLQF